ncbi:MAG: threonylcarbamoyl-AMP synthase [Actinomycetaceae bacterium]|nr:threonylcarbamoyl-AMP synthase [Actinomycetaceae bacterium]
MRIVQVDDAGARAADLRLVRDIVADGQVICLPTDTVYGIGADPFNSSAVDALLTAKSRTRAMPPPVLVANLDQARSLVADIPTPAHALIDAFWPGALTIILPAAPHLGWDLGETEGTVALRMPDLQVTRDILESVGPLAVTSANLTGQPPATSIGQAYEQLGEAVSLYLDAGPSRGGVPSTIVRWEGQRFAVVRVGAISVAQLAEVSELAGADVFPAIGTAGSSEMRAKP